MKWLKYWIGLMLFFVFALVLSAYLQSSTTFLDYPYKLSPQKETIEVVYVNWACDCADFIKTKYLARNPSGQIREEDCIFIEPAQAALKLSERFYAKDHFKKKLRLYGQFYLDKGISRFYEQKTPEKAAPAKVFQYSKIEMVDFEK